MALAPFDDGLDSAVAGDDGFAKGVKLGEVELEEGADLLGREGGVLGEGESEVEHATFEEVGDALEFGLLLEGGKGAEEGRV